MSAPERCPCCGGLVNGNRYELTLFDLSVLVTMPVCKACEGTLTGDDRAAHDALVMTFINKMRARANAHTVH